MFTKPEILDVRAIPKLKMNTGTTIASLTRGGPLSKVGELVKSREEYDAKLKILDEMQSEIDAEEDIKSVVSE